MGSASMAHFAFGHSNTHFSDMTISTITVFDMFFSRFDYEAMKKADPILAPMIFSAIMLVCVFILCNLFIAILADAYSRVKFS